ncbi:hypothetical protein NK6_8899 [Bradyrhizobium diazoefficiens]|jgi:hypothetical protein|uniref:Uncharacterized protein n=1 Tax=Bradyrhizobium diazoefficiens TaxID=1355477 RepID=A0A0E4FXR9_9BRAD|nr:hypothetical protein NK6_8899 [Bradyrhizobium diazoefficiens]
MSLLYIIKAKGCVTEVPHLSENASERLDWILGREQQKGRREAGLS